MRVLDDAKRDALAQLCDAWLLAASATLALHGYRVQQRGDAVFIDGDRPFAATLEALREGCLYGESSFCAVVALDALERLIFSARGFEVFIELPTGTSLVRADGTTLTRIAAIEFVRLEAALWEDARPTTVPVPLPCSMLVSRLRACGREVDRVVDDAIQASRSHTAAAPSVTSSSEVRARLENALRADARLAAELCARIARHIGYLDEEASRERAANEPLADASSASATDRDDNSAHDEVANATSDLGSTMLAREPR